LALHLLRARECNPIFPTSNRPSRTIGKAILYGPNLHPGRYRLTRLQPRGQASNAVNVTTCLSNSK